MGIWAMLKVLFAVAALAYVAIAAWLYVTQPKAVYFPIAGNTADPSDLGLAFEDLRLGPDGRVHGWYVPANEPQNGPFVLFCHGNAGNLSGRLETVRILHGLGANVLLFDYQGFGLSHGEPSEEGTYADARAAWDWLEERGVPASRIVVMGRSLGGAVAAALAERLGRGGVRPAGLILESTFTSVPDMAQRMYPWFPVRPLCRFYYNTRKRLGRISVPVLVLHSPDDAIVPFAFGQELFAAAGDPKRFVQLTGSHGQGFLLSGTVYTDALAEFFASLEGARAGQED